MVKRRPGRNGGKRGPGNDLGGSLVEYALVLSLVAVVAAGALVYLGSSVSHTVNKISVAVTTDPPSTTTTAPPVFQPTVVPTPGARCGVDANGTTLSGLCTGAGGYAWLDGKFFYPPPNGPWTPITAANDGSTFQCGHANPSGLDLQ